MRKLVLLIVLQLAIIACGGKESTPTPTPETPKPLGKAVLKTPSNNQICTENPVTFKWEAVEHATTYVLTVLNADGTKHKESSIANLEETISFPKGKSFSWKVIAKNKQGETTSETRSFITEGESLVNFVPTASIEMNDKDKTINISFYDEDKDKLTYTVYYTTNNSFSDKDILEEHSKVIISSGKTITLKNLDFSKKFWLKVLIIDDKGNQSEAISGF